MPGRFPASALPPEGLAGGAGRVALRRALARGDWGEADNLWASVLRTLQPLGPAGRAELSRSLAAYAELKDAVGDGEAAARLRRRALSAAKDPAELQRKVGGAGQRGGWEDRVGRPADDGVSPRALAVRAELDRAEAEGRRRALGWGLVAGAVGGSWIAAVSGLPFALLIPLGMASGGAWIWARRA